MTAFKYDGLSPSALAHLAGVPRIALHEHVPSTMDAAHDLAELGAPAGTIVLAERQTAGRGRGGRAWVSSPGASITMTLIERPTDARAVSVLSLRLGLRAAEVLDRYATSPVQLKWPNDLMLPGGKLGGILVEARWRNQRLDWAAIGIGINVAEPGLRGTAGLVEGVARLDILAQLVPALREGVAAKGDLTDVELSSYQLRDWARGRQAMLPVSGMVRGLSPAGALIIDTTGGPVECTSGSLVLSGS